MINIVKKIIKLLLVLLAFVFALNINNTVSPNNLEVGVGEVSEIEILKARDNGVESDEIDWYYTTADITVNKMIIYKNTDIFNLLDLFYLNHLEINIIPEPLTDDNYEKYFNLLYITIKNTDNEDLSITGDLALFISGNFLGFEYDLFTFELLNYSKYRILQSGDEIEYIFPFIFYDHFFEEDLEEVIKGEFYLGSRGNIEQYDKLLVRLN